MRRSDREITDKEVIYALIEQCDVCRVAFNDEDTGFPYILPLNFGFMKDGESAALYFHGAAEGYKYEVLRRDARVSFEMDCGHHLFSKEDIGYCTMEYQSIIGCGTMEIVTGDDEKKRALSIITDHYHEKHFPYNERSISRTVVMRLHITEMTAKHRTIKRQGL